MQDQTKCKICLECFKDPIALECGHSFCAQCIRQQEKRNNYQCALCRESFCNQKKAINYALREVVEACQHFQVENFCLKHNVALTLVCKSCDYTVLCSSCAFESHRDRDHEVEDISKAYQCLSSRVKQCDSLTKKLSPRIKQDLESCEKRKKNLKESIQKATQELEAVESQEKEIKYKDVQLKENLKLASDLLGTSADENYQFRKIVEHLEATEGPLDFFRNLQNPIPQSTPNNPVPSVTSDSRIRSGKEEGFMKVVKKSRKVHTPKVPRTPVDCYMKENDVTRTEAEKKLRDLRNWKSILCKCGTRSNCAHPNCSFFHPGDFEYQNYCIQCFNCFQTKEQLRNFTCSGCSTTRIVCK